MQAALRQGVVIHQQGQGGGIGGVVGVVGKSTCKVDVAAGSGGCRCSERAALHVVARHPGSALLLKIRVLAN